MLLQQHTVDADVIACVYVDVDAHGSGSIHASVECQCTCRFKCNRVCLALPGLTCLAMIINGIPHFTHPRTCCVHYLHTSSLINYTIVETKM